MFDGSEKLKDPNKWVYSKQQIVQARKDFSCGILARLSFREEAPLMSKKWLSRESHLNPSVLANPVACSALPMLVPIRRATVDPGLHRILALTCSSAGS